LAKYSNFYPKIALSAYFGSRKIVKKQNIPNPYIGMRQIPQGTFLPIFRAIEAFPTDLNDFPSKNVFKIFAASAKK